MKLFNAFQLVILFMSWPFILNWVDASTFAGHSALWYVCLVAFLIHFGISIWAFYELLDLEK